MATSLAAAAVAGFVALPAAADASTTPPPAPTTPPAPASGQPAAVSATSSALEQRLLHDLQLRATQLANLSKEVSAATALTPGDQGALEQKLASATTSIDGLIQSVPTDTRAQLRAAARTMIAQNRVFAVLTPQVYEVISADTVAGQATVLASDEPALQAQVTATQGQVGYRDAASHYAAFARAVKQAETDTARVSARLLAETPQDYRRGRRLFVRSNRQILAAAEALAKAGYDKTIIALATNGYTGA